MKQLFSLLLALAMCLSLVACGGGNGAAVQGADPVFETAEITMDNWQEYLEIRIDPQRREWYTDSFDKVIQCNDYLCLTVKDEYSDRIDENAIDIAVAYSYVMSFIEYDIDFENKRLTYGAIGIPAELQDSGHLGGDHVHEKTGQMDHTSMVIYSPGFYHESIGSTPLTETLGDKSYITFPVVTVTQIQGTVKILPS